jgi:predicted Zn-dependent protease
VNHFPAAPYSPDYLGLLPSKVKWNKTALTYSVDRGVDSRTQEALEALLAEATARWSTATNNLVTFTRVSSGADIQVTFVSASDPDIGAGESGSTLYTFSSPVDNRSLVTSAAVKIRAELPDGQFVPLVAHEIGHALGISGHSNQSGDTMFPSVSSSVFVTARDANTLARLYLTAD